LARKKLSRPEVVSRRLNSSNKVREVSFRHDGLQAFESLKYSINIDVAVPNILPVEYCFDLLRDHRQRPNRIEQDSPWITPNIARRDMIDQSSNLALKLGQV
jgi:hypothetical protein